MLLVILSETRASAKIDAGYINAFLHLKYEVIERRKVTVKHVYMNTKTAYAKNEKKIDELKAQYMCTHGNRAAVRVVMCVDSDYGEPGAGINDDIVSYCRTHGYDLVWFHREVEEVFLGKRVAKAEKKKEMELFLRSQKYHTMEIDGAKFRSCDIHHSRFGTSNIASVFDAIFEDFYLK